ncbi:hypothetical protein KY340_03210, partial [Candidatus Woesearchaeota archaeon]|nr:hypothetical protein [Candidatus Woesearchaeota archaeon]
MGVRNFFKEGLETRVRTIGKGLVLGLSAFATLAALGSAAEAGGVFANGGSGNLYADSSYHSQTYSRPNYNWWQLKRATEEYRRQRERTRIIERSRAINDCGLYANSGTVNEPALFANSGSHSSTWRGRTDRARIGRTIERRVEENTERETARTAFAGRTYAEASVRAAPRPREERKEKEVTITEDENNHIIFVKGESEPIIIPKRK